MSKLGSVVVGLFGLGMLAIVGCASETEGDAESSGDALSSSCIKQIDAAPGSAEHTAAVKECERQARSDRGTDGGADSDGAAAPSGSGKPSGSGDAPASEKPTKTPGEEVEPEPGNRLSINCSAGTCTCAAGPRSGETCDGTTKTGEEACSVKCRY